MTDHKHPTDVSPDEADAMDYDGPDRDVKPAAEHTLRCERKDCPTLRFSGPVGAWVGCPAVGCDKRIGSGDWGYNATGPQL